MPGLVPGIHVFKAQIGSKTWMAGTSPAMTGEWPGDYQCAMNTGIVAFARMWRVAPPKIICRSRLCV
jgi:hypothetical protein